MTAEDLKESIIQALLPALIGGAADYPSDIAEKEIEAVLQYGRRTIKAFSTDELILSDYARDKQSLYGVVTSMVFQASWLYVTKWHFERSCMEDGSFPNRMNEDGTWEEYCLLLQGMRMSRSSYIELYDAIFQRWIDLTHEYWDTPITGSYMQQAIEAIFIVGAHIPYLFMKI